MRVLVVGCGAAGRRHAVNAARAGAEVAVCDVDEARASAAAQECGGPAFEAFAAALRWRPDGVVVATPQESHLAIAAEALAAGAHVLVEKPIAARLEGIGELLDQADAVRRCVFVVCNMRFHPGPATLRAELSQIGKPLYARAHFGSYLPNQRTGVDYRSVYAASRDAGGGVILDAVHEIDYLSWLLGRPDEVVCVAEKLSQLEIDAEDYAAIALRHAGGARAEIHLDYLQVHKRRGCEIVGEAGALIWQSEGKEPEVCTVRLFENEQRAWRDLAYIPDLDKLAPYRQVMDRFLAALAGGRHGDLLTGREAAFEVAVALSAHASAQHGRAERPRAA